MRNGLAAAPMNAEPIYELNDTDAVSPLFEGMDDTLITSCLQRVMGRIYVTDAEAPRSAFAFLGCFGFFAGEPDRRLVRHKPEGFVIMIPQNAQWARLIEEIYPDAKKVVRYAFKKGARFDRERLRENVRQLPEGYELKEIDAGLYDKCMESPVTADFVSSFSDREAFLRDGRGVVAVKDGRIVSGASSYSRFREGVEIEVDTVPEERRKHLALACCSALILRCLGEGLYPSWDAQNKASVALAEKLGYEFDREYEAYEDTA